MPFYILNLNVILKQQYDITFLVTFTNFTNFLSIYEDKQFFLKTYAIVIYT